MTTILRVQVAGHTLDAATFAALQLAERKLGHRLSITQGSFRTNVTQSAGTHAGSGAVDLETGHLPKRIVRVLRSVGFAAWHRTPDQGDWPEHIHAILIGSPELSGPAARQVVAYMAGRDGLASNQPDNAFRPVPQPVFAWPQRTRGEHVDDSIAASRAALKQAKSKARKQTIRDALNTLRSLPTRPKVTRS